jgi:hypothetical protein
VASEGRCSGCCCDEAQPVLVPYPGGGRQLTAVFLSIQRSKGTDAAKAWYRKAQREGYAPVAKDDKMRVKKRAKRKVRRGPESGYRATAAVYKRERAKGQELKRDPGDLVLTGRGSAAQERKRDPGELYSRAGSKPKQKARPNAKAPLGSGGRFAALEQRLQGRKGVTDPGALAAAIGRKKYGAKRFQKLGR